MTIGDQARRAHLAARVMQTGIAVFLVAGLVAGNLPLVVNAAIGLAVTVVPALLERDWDITLSPRLTVLIGLAVSLHTLGMVHLYGATPWWDHLTHTISAALVAIAGYAVVGAIDVHTDAIHLPPTFMFWFILLFTLAMGVFWEVIEFAARGLARAIGADPFLDQFGLEDTLVDLVFDAVGAVIVATYGHRDVRALRDELVGRLAGERAR